jgi:tyrosyl-tRNA synthetase
MCGTDQKFNCLVGRALQVEEGQEPEVILAMPILEGLDGVKKMSKSLGNYVGISEGPNEMFSKLMSVSDPLMWRYYELLSDDAAWPAKKAKVEKSEHHPKLAKMELAREITSRFHGNQKAQDAWTYFESRHDLNTSVDYPEIHVTPGPYKAADFLLLVGISKTKSDAKRLIEQGAVEWVNGRQEKKKISSFNELIDISAEETGLIRSGKVFLKILPKK